METILININDIGYSKLFKDFLRTLPYISNIESITFEDNHFAEIEKRLQKITKGESVFIDGESVFNEIDNKLNEL